MTPAQQARRDRQSAAFEAQGVRADVCAATGRALAEESHARGERLTIDHRDALNHDMHFGSDGWPIRKIGRKWTIEHHLLKGAPLFPTKAQAEDAWQIQIFKWEKMKALEAL